MSKLIKEMGNKRIKVLMIGPDPVRSKGGMAAIIRGVLKDEEFNRRFTITIYPSYVDGSIVVRLLFTIIRLLMFPLVYRHYNLFHIHMASYGSTYRKILYLRFLKWRNKKVILHIHGASFLSFYQGLKESKKRYIRDNLNRADIVIALSEEWRQQISDNLGLHNIYVLNNGIDTDIYQVAATNPDMYHNQFLFLGRVGFRKGAYDLLEAVNQQKQEGKSLKIYFAGDGELDKFRKLIKEKNLEDMVELLGWVEQKDKIELLKRVAVIILPSYQEGLPIALLEGMAAGKAVISTRVGAIPELVTEGENGILINPGDIPALKDAMVTLSENMNLLERMSRANRDKIEAEFGRRKMHSILAEYYNEVYNNKEKGM